MVAAINPAVPAAETLTTAPYPPHGYATITPTSQPRVSHESVTPSRCTSWLRTLLKIALCLDLAVLALLLIITLALISSRQPPGIYVEHAFNKDNVTAQRVQAIVKRIPPGSVQDDHVILGILVGGLVLALVFGLVTSWVIQRTQLGPAKKRSGGSQVDGPWTVRYKQVVA